MEGEDLAASDAEESLSPPPGYGPSAMDELAASEHSDEFSDLEVIDRMDELRSEEVDAHAVPADDGAGAERVVAPAEEFHDVGQALDLARGRFIPPVGPRRGRPSRAAIALRNLQQSNAAEGRVVRPPVVAPMPPPVPELAIVPVVADERGAVMVPAHGAAGLDEAQVVAFPRLEIETYQGYAIVSATPAECERRAMDLADHPAEIDADVSEACVAFAESGSVLSKVARARSANLSTDTWWRGVRRFVTMWFLHALH